MLHFIRRLLYFAKSQPCYYYYHYTTTSTTTPCFCYSPAGVNIQEFSDLLLSYQSAISTVFDLLQIIILLQNSHFSQKKVMSGGSEMPAGSGTLPPPFGLRFSPFHCKTSVMFLWLFFRYKTRYQRPEVIGPLWPCVAESPKKKINYKKNYEDDFAHYCYYCCYCPPILFSKKN